MKVHNLGNNIIYIENAFPLSKEFVKALEDNDQNANINGVIPQWTPWKKRVERKLDFKFVNWDYRINEGNIFWPRKEISLDHTPAHKEAYDILKMIDKPFLEALELWYKETGNKKLDWVTKNYTIKKYYPGAGVGSHADRMDSKTQTFDWTCLVYLNDDYEGGELYFDDLDITVSPTAGSAIFFSTDYMHTGKKVVSGNKYFLFFYIQSKFGMCHSMKENVGNVVTDYFLKNDNGL